MKLIETKISEFATPPSLISHKEELESQISSMRYKIEEQNNQFEISEHIRNRIQTDLLITKDKLNEIEVIVKEFNEKTEKWKRIKYVASKKTSSNPLCNLYLSVTAILCIL